MAAPSGDAGTPTLVTNIPLPDTERQDSEATEVIEALPLHLRPDVLERLEKDMPVQESTEQDENTEEALDSHQVIELQTFIDRKTWIEEKIQILAKMPPVEVFVGLDALRTSAEVVPGLPTRAELKQWVVEHDAVEKETEIFDSGELTKLRKFTKAATQRHLSREDTDLIELTLTTIYELDKLLHLLRDRSENLDLLGIRLDWEDARVAAWKDRRKLIADVHSFLENHARWSPSAYESYDHLPDDTTTRRGSIASVASDSSASTFHGALSRAARFKLSERLSREAAQLSGRISVLRHSRADAAGKALDKLIDTSRRAVPDELLDEQDRVEEKCIEQFEDLGDFVMDVVTQWRKADEIYVETLKDAASAQALLEELEMARLQHPVAKQSVLFCARADTLLKRLKMRGNPSADSSDFPCPAHRLIGDQHYANEAVVQKLSAELAKTLSIIKKVDYLAKEHRETSEAVNEVENLSNVWSKLSQSLVQCTEKLSTGISNCEGDGSPPDLSTQVCLESPRHATYLAFLPSVQSEHDTLSNQVEQLTELSYSAIRRLGRPGISDSFKAQSSETFESLLRLARQGQTLREDVQKRVERLRLARAIWTDMVDTIGRLLLAKHALDASLEAKRWRSSSSGASDNTALSTPESIMDTPLPDTEASTISTMLGDISSTIIQRIQLPLETAGPDLELPLQSWLSQHLDAIQAGIGGLRQNLLVLNGVTSQASAAKLAREEFQGFQIEIESLKLRIEEDALHVLEQTSNPEHKLELTSAITKDVALLRGRVDGFLESLPGRIPFTARISSQAYPRHTPKQPSVSELPSGSNVAGTQPWDSSYISLLPFDLNMVDAAVRTECNTISMTLSGALRDIDNASNYFQGALLSARIDADLQSLSDGLEQAYSDIESRRASFNAKYDGIALAEHIQSIQVNLQDVTATHRTRLSRSLSSLRQLMEQLADLPDSRSGGGLRIDLYTSRSRSLKDAAGHYTRWGVQVDTLAGDISAALTQESARQIQLRLEQEEARRLAEKHAQEEATAQRLHEERLEKERLAVEEDQRRRQEEEARDAVRLVQERAVAEEAERLKLKEAALAEEWVRLEEERSAAEATNMRHSISNSSFKSEGDTLISGMAEKDMLSLDDSSFRTLSVSELSLNLNSSPQHKIQPLSKSSEGDLVSDVFGPGPQLLVPIAGAAVSREQDITQIRTHIHTLRRRLISTGIHDLIRPPHSSSIAPLPSPEHIERTISLFRAIRDEAELLPHSVSDISIDTELRSFRSELQSATESSSSLSHLAKISEAVGACDTALSNLLEHIDSYPHPPVLLTTPQPLLPGTRPEEQLKATAAFAQQEIHRLRILSDEVEGDSCVQSEHTRILQTWVELKEMADERIAGRSRPPSAASITPSSGRNTSASIAARSLKKASYSNLSLGVSKGRLLVPSTATTTGRRAVSGSHGLPPRSPSQLSNSSTRSVSGSFGIAHKSTFSSRQRTNSVIASPMTDSQTSRVRQQTVPPKRMKTPSISAQSFSSLSRSSGTFSRTPRHSISSPPAAPSTPSRGSTTAKRRPYVANPKNKLDVAVGSVVNNLPVNINVEVVEDTWKDQSGKYWIGDQDPKLCFCRILRSHTVMVRVGGGWSELSKFIKDHFADAFRLLPDSPPRPTASEEKWISSATLLEAVELAQSPPRPLKTPEPRFPFPSSFPHSPGAESSHSVHSTPSKGSPLTPLQFMRRAGVESPAFPQLVRPGTPSKTSTLRPRATGLLSSSTSSRNSIWRP